MHANNLFPNLDDTATLKQLNGHVLCFLFLHANKQSLSYFDSTATIKTLNGLTYKIIGFSDSLEFFLVLYFFIQFIKNICRDFFFKNVTLPPVHPAEGCYRRFNRR